MRLPFSSKSFTYAFWYMPLERPTGHWRNIFSRGVNDRNRLPGLWLYPRSMRLHVRVSRKLHWNDGCDPRQQLRIGKWVHIAITVHRGVLRVLFNGRQVCANGHYKSGTKLSTGPLKIVYRRYMPAKGALARLRIYNHGQSVSEINRHKARSAPSVPFSRYQSSANGECMDVSGGRGRKGARVIMYRCHGGSNQQWRLMPNGQIRSRLGGCLDVAGANKRHRAPLIFWKCHNGANQKFYYDQKGRLRSRLNHFCVDNSQGGRRNRRAQIWMWPCHHGSNQRFVPV